MFDRQTVMELWGEVLDAKPTKCATRACGMMVKNKANFKAGNVFGGWEFPRFKEDASPMYVVWSFGDHYPMYIYEPMEKVWFGNSTTWSRTTSKHASQAHPGYCMRVDNDTMLEIVSHGVQYVYERATEND